jgi:hypothetical protein
MAETSTEEKVQKSIVPSKYAGRYRRGGSDALAAFINEQCTVDGKFSFDKFWDLCRANELPETEVEKYADQVADKKFGAPGRARMTLRNRLAAIARKEGGLKNLKGRTVPISLTRPDGEEEAA